MRIKKRRPRPNQGRRSSQGGVGVARAGNNESSAQKNAKKLLQSGQNEADEKPYNGYAPTTEKPIMLSLIQSASLSKNELRQAGMRAPQISPDVRHRVVR
jgi:hypothetical protein